MMATKNKLSAAFNTERETLEIINRLYQRRCHETLDIEFTNEHGKWTTATGRRQDVMTFIGEVAAQGFDFLEYVRGPNA